MADESKFVKAEHKGAGRLQPVNQNRFIVTRLTIQKRRNKIAAYKHFARGLTERALVEIKQGNGVNIQIKTHRHGE